MIDFSILMQYINSFSTLEVNQSQVEGKPYDILYLRICNKIKRNVTVNVPFVNNVDDWVGDNRPDFNINNIEISSGSCYESEENVAIMTTTSAIFKIDFKIIDSANKVYKLYTYIDQICIKNIICDYNILKINLLDQTTGLKSKYYLEPNRDENSTSEFVLRKN